LESDVRVRVTLRLIVSQWVFLGVEPTLWAFDQILLPFQVIGSGICCPVSVGRPLWREAGSVLCKSQSSHLSVCAFTIYIFVFHIVEVEVEVTLRLTVSQSVCLGIEYPCGTWDKILFPVGMIAVWNLRSCICGAPSLTRGRVCWSRSYFTTDSQSVCLGIEYPCETCDQIFFPIGMLLSEICGLVSIGRPLWREDGSAICSVIAK
jgi:hypothetical protein